MLLDFPVFKGDYVLCTQSSQGYRPRGFWYSCGEMYKVRHACNDRVLLVSERVKSTKGKHGANFAPACKAIRVLYGI